MRKLLRAGTLGAIFALAIAVALYTRFSLDDTLRRDEAIYAYGGQQLAAVPPTSTRSGSRSSPSPA